MAFRSLPGQGKDQPHAQGAGEAQLRHKRAGACGLPWQQQLVGKEPRGCRERRFSLLVLNDQLYFCRRDRGGEVMGKRGQTRETWEWGQNSPSNLYGDSVAFQRIG